MKHLRKIMDSSPGDLSKIKKLIEKFPNLALLIILKIQVEEKIKKEKDKNKKKKLEELLKLLNKKIEELLKKLPRLEHRDIFNLEKAVRNISTIDTHTRRVSAELESSVEKRKKEKLTYQPTIDALIRDISYIASYILTIQYNLQQEKIKSLTKLVKDETDLIRIDKRLDEKINSIFRGPSFTAPNVYINKKMIEYLRRDAKDILRRMIRNTLIGEKIYYDKYGKQKESSRIRQIPWSLRYYYKSRNS